MTVLRSLADAHVAEFVFVEGNAELSAVAHFVGTFDPAQVLADGYGPDAYVDGPLVHHAHDGGLHQEGDQPGPQKRPSTCSSR